MRSTCWPRRSWSSARRAVPGSLEALRLTPQHEYAHLVVGANNGSLPPPSARPASAATCRGPGSARAPPPTSPGQARFLRGALARRLHEGGRPSFPPSTRDALLLGGTVFGLLEREQGAAACVRLASKLHPGGQLAAIEEAFGASGTEVELEWRRYLTELTELRAV